MTSKWTVSSELNQRHLKASSSLIHLKTQWLTFPNKEPNKKTILQSAWSCANIITTNVGLKINGFWTKSLAGRKGGVFVIKKKTQIQFFFSGLQTTVINVGSETWSVWRLWCVNVSLNIAQGYVTVTHCIHTHTVSRPGFWFFLNRIVFLERKCIISSWFSSPELINWWPVGQVLPAGPAKTVRKKKTASTHVHD